VRVSSVDLEVMSRGYSGLKRATTASADSLVGRSMVKVIGERCFVAGG